jgi:hypothetical protein
MRTTRLEVRLYLVVLIVCTAALVGLVHAEGWIWPLKAAAVMIPVSILVS